MQIHGLVSLLSCFSLVYSADQYKVSFFGCDPIAAAKEVKVIDWVLSYATKKQSMTAIAQKIEMEQYTYLREDDGDHDICCSAMEEVPCPLHIRLRLTKQNNNHDYIFLEQLVPIKTTFIILKRATENGFMPGFNDDSWERNFDPSDPPIHLEVLVKGASDANQNRINKNYLLTQLHAVCTNEPNDKGEQ